MCNRADQALSVSKKRIYFEEGYSWLIVLKDLRLFRDLEESQHKIKYKGMLMATITHDMRTPVNSILGMLQIIEIYLPLEHSKYLNIAKSSCNLLLHLIHDILVINYYLHIQIHTHIYIYIYICMCVCFVYLIYIGLL